MKTKIHIYYFLFVVSFINIECYTFKNEEELDNFVKGEYEAAASAMCTKSALAQWDYQTDLGNTVKEEALLNNTLEYAAFNKEYWEKYFKDLKLEDYKSEILKRQLKDLVLPGIATMDNTKLTEMTTLSNEMSNIYSRAKICPFQKQNCELPKEGLNLDPEIETIMKNSIDYEELEYVWSAWRKASGSKLKEQYKKYISLSNEYAKANRYQDKGDMWRSKYESPNFIQDVDKLWEQVKPLYEELHKYVGNKLKKRYKDEIDLSDGLIPAHVFGNMWAQSWVNLYDLVVPFPKASNADVTQALKEQNYTVLKMFRVADEFYKSLGLEPTGICYDVSKGAMIEKPSNKEVVCHASAWDFCDGKNYRIKMCTKINYEDFITIHHEMGHIQYYLLYKKQPKTLRTGANPGFHEAIGDTIALSVANPLHLMKIKLLKNYDDSFEANLNALMKMALERVAFLPFGLLIDKWRWDIYSGKVPYENWNSHWWNYRRKIQQVKEPIPRSDAIDFDPGAKYHVPNDSQYINYFIAHILEFQLYRSLCISSGEYDPTKKDTPLHKCDFYQSKAAGDKLRAGLSLGSSVHWSEVLNKMTGQKELDATAILEYFEPLYKYLKIQNQMTEENLKEFLENQYETEASQIINQQVHAEWDFATDLGNAAKEQTQLETTLITAEFEKKHWTDTFQYLNENDYKSEEIKRQVRFLKVLGNAALSKDKLSELTNAGTSMTNAYSTAKICPFNKQICDLAKEGLSLDPDIEEIISTSTNYDELEYVWKAWRDVSGAPIKDTYKTYVQLSNEAAKANGFDDKGALWRSDYESPKFIEDMDRIWEKVKPLYNELHRYVTKKLKERYKDKFNTDDGFIPAHILGNMWAQTWINLADLVKPYPSASPIDVTSELVKQGYDALKMFQTSDDFYKSLGLESNEMCYDQSLAVITKPKDREIVCHASAWDFYDKKDFRVKMCTNVNYEDFITIHHEMGHIQYFILYKNQLVTFRDGANPGFHEAIGDTIALSVSTPKHLQTVGLLKDYDNSEEADINALMDMALERIAFLPFGLLIDKWRWDVFAGIVPPEKWNSHWWHYRFVFAEYNSKVKAPVLRSDTTDFDPGAKYHIPGDSQYINYFFAHILEFQLYKTLCIAAGEYGPSKPNVPLHSCDFYKSKEAGKKLRDGLSLGKSKHWTDVLEIITGQRDLDASALLEYFDPLFKFMKKENGPYKIESELKTFLEIDYEPSASKSQYDQVVAEWNFVTDVSSTEKEQAQVEATKRSAEFEKFYWDNYFKDLTEQDYKNEQTQRQVRALKQLGYAALDEDKLVELTNTQNEMTNIYSTAKICPYNKKDSCNLETEGLSLEPDIEKIMATSNDYKELEYAWTAWRDASGAKIKDKYPKYVELSNEAAVKNDFDDMGEMWRDDYESPTFIADIDELWEEVKPLYDELHKFVGNKLKNKYGDALDASDGLLPAHVFGNMWAQTWGNLFPLVKPYPDASEIDVTSALLEQNYTPLKMFETSDEFYKSLGLESNDMSYDEKRGAIIVKPKDRDILCHASAWDFSNGEDFRIKMCTDVNYEDFVTIHHEMGHIQYFILYKNQPVVFRTGANPGFHEAIGDTIALSVQTPKHLKKIGLLKNYSESKESDLNTLMDMALNRVAFLPFGLLIDKWRWDVFSGTVPKKNGTRIGGLTEKYQKIKAPRQRSDEHDFDPGAKYHIPGNSQYMNYFIARILQFQLYKSLCIAAGEYDPNDKSRPLHQCDFYQSIKAGDKLRAGLSLGASKHWSDALQEMTGETEISASALLEYFEPLMQYLREQNGSNYETPESQMVPIIVGSVLGVLLVCGIAFYGYKRCRQND